MTMKPTYLLILASFLVCTLTISTGQSFPAEDERDQRNENDVVLPKVKSLLLRSILRNMQDEDGRYEGFSSQSEGVTKRQHPGRRSNEDLEKRQHPGRREDYEDEQYLDVKKRQHPGKREDEMHSFVEFQKRQHPGKRSTMEHISENPFIVLSELSKRQHPGKRYLVLPVKSQLPGVRYSVGEDGDGESDAYEDLPELEKRQHPGKRFWDNSNPEIGTNIPCDVLDPTSCSKTSLLLNFLGDINKTHAEEKRQHPGKRLAPDEDLVEAK